MTTRSSITECGLTANWVAVLRARHTAPCSRPSSAVERPTRLRALLGEDVAACCRLASARSSLRQRHRFHAEASTSAAAVAKATAAA
eukprot:scaffold296914_cov33-Tisochrysis_lutea.AAC.8